MYTFKFQNQVELSDEIKEQFSVLTSKITELPTDVRTIAITSAQNEEGKTFVSFHIACTLAKAGYRVMVLMADMRKTTAIGEETLMGIVDVLDGRIDVDKAIYDTDIEGVNIMFSGATKVNETLNLERSIYSVMIKALKDDYNYIIIDMPTLGKTDNDEIFLREADTGIMVIQPNRTSKKKMLRSIETIKSYDCNVLGAVLNNR